MNSPSSFEPAQQTRLTRSRNPILSNHFPIPKSAHRGNPRKTNHLRTLHKNTGVYGVSSQNGNRENYFDGIGATDGSFTPRSHTARSRISIAHASAIETFWIFDERATSLSRVP